MQHCTPPQLQFVRSVIVTLTMMTGQGLQNAKRNIGTNKLDRLLHS
jgi:hypothetical protein